MFLFIRQEPLSKGVKGLLCHVIYSQTVAQESGPNVGIFHFVELPGLRQVKGMTSRRTSFRRCLRCGFLHLSFEGPGLRGLMLQTCATGVLSVLVPARHGAASGVSS